LAQAAAHLARIVGNADLARLGPYWILIVVYWLLVHLTTGQLAALMLHYVVLKDASEKKD
jgi:hypothetical protein